MINYKSKIKGFTLIELLVVISIIGVISSVIFVNIKTARAKARDVRRLSDMHQMQIALDMYFNSFGRYPDSDFAGNGGWDTSGDGTFITPLVSNKFISAHLSDPTINNADGNYVYYRYPGGCNNHPGAFYVLGIRDMETSNNPYRSSPGFSCLNRNWQDGFEWVTGKFEQ